MPLLAYGQLALSMALVGVTVTFGKLLLLYLTPWAILLIRFAASNLVMVPGLRAARPRGAGQWALVGALSLCGTVLFSALMLSGLRHTSATAAALLTATLPAVTALFAALFLRERLTRRDGAALLLAVAGIAVINLQSVERSGQAALLGNSLILAAVACEAGYVMLSKRLVGVLPAASVIAWNNLLALVLLAPLWPSVIADLPADVPLWLWPLAVFSGLCASVFAVDLWLRGLRHVPARTAAPFTGIMPLAGTLSAVWLLGEAFLLGHAFGLACVLGALYVATR